jgi:hypothetical protein
MDFGAGRKGEDVMFNIYIPRRTALRHVQSLVSRPRNHHVFVIHAAAPSPFPHPTMPESVDDDANECFFF